MKKIFFLKKVLNFLVLNSLGCLWRSMREENKNLFVVHDRETKYTRKGGSALVEKKYFLLVITQYWENVCLSRIIFGIVAVRNFYRQGWDNLLGTFMWDTAILFSMWSTFICEFSSSFDFLLARGQLNACVTLIQCLDFPDIWGLALNMI